MAREKQTSVRQLRVGEELRHALAELLGHGDLRDPDLRGRSLTVTEVQVSPDLRNATAFVIPLGGGGEETMLAALRRAAPYLKSQVGRMLRLRHVPGLQFERDPTFDQAQRIDRILKQPEVARDLGEGAEEREGKDDDGTA